MHVTFVYGASMQNSGVHHALTNGGGNNEWQCQLLLPK